MSATTSSSDQPPRFLADVNFNGRIITGLRRRIPEIDLVTAQDLGLQQTPDPALLVEARTLDRILLTHDINTMPQHFATFLATLTQGEHSPGVMLMAQGLPIGTAIQELYEIWSCSAHSEWRDQFTYLPL